MSNLFALSLGIYITTESQKVVVLACFTYIHSIRVYKIFDYQLLKFKNFV